MISESQTQLAPADLAELCGTAAEIGPESLIPILQNVQAKYSYLPASVLNQISKYTSIPASRIYGVATFYEQFYLAPRGRHIVKCCRGTACHVKRATRIIEALESELNVGDGETTEDLKFTFETVACLGTCFLAPVIMVDNDYYGNVTPNKIKSILDQYE